MLVISSAAARVAHPHVDNLWLRSLETPKHERLATIRWQRDLPGTLAPRGA